MGSMSSCKPSLLQVLAVADIPPGLHQRRVLWRGRYRHGGRPEWPAQGGPRSRSYGVGSVL